MDLKRNAVEKQKVTVQVLKVYSKPLHCSSSCWHWKSISGITSSPTRPQSQVDLMIILGMHEYAPICVFCASTASSALLPKTNEIFSCDAAGEKNLRLLSKNAEYLTTPEMRKLTFK